MQEGQAGKILASFSGITWTAFANVVSAGWIRLEANAKLALVLLARRGLRVEHCHHRCSFAELSGELRRTFTNVVVDAINTGSSVLAHVIDAIVNIFRAVQASIARYTFATVVSRMIDTFGTILARVEVLPAEFDLRITKLSGESWNAGTAVGIDSVHTRCIVQAFMVGAIIDVDFTPGS